MKNTTDKTTKLLGTLFAALCACALAACGDGGATGTDAGSEEANASSSGTNDGPFKVVLVGESSETSSSSSSFYYSFSGPTCCGKDAYYLFEFPGPDGRQHGSGGMFPDDSRYSDSASAQIVLLHDDGKYHPARQSLDIDACPSHDSVESGVSDCYWGWNEYDMIKDSSYKVGVKLMKFADEDSLGFTNGGLFYILDGRDFASATPYSICPGIIVEVKAKSGMPVKIYAQDRVEYADDESMPRYGFAGIAKYGFTGTGDWQTVIVPCGSFTSRPGAIDAFDPTHVLGIGIEYELSATELGQPCDLCSDEILDLEWRKLWLQ